MLERNTIVNFRRGLENVICSLKLVFLTLFTIVKANGKRSLRVVTERQYLKKKFESQLKFLTRYVKGCSEMKHLALKLENNKNSFAAKVVKEITSIGAVLHEYFIFDFLQKLL